MAGLGISDAIAYTHWIFILKSQNMVKFGSVGKRIKNGTKNVKVPIP